MFCKHEWEVLSETTTKSKFEMMVECGLTNIKNSSGLDDMMSRKVIQIVTCKKCGKIKKFVEYLI